ncbi:MAG TPA: YetF domain-containing protein [Gammaproteobacteria bacterium]
METVIRGIGVYAFLLLIFRISGQRSLGQVTTFDFVLLLIIAETTQQALLGEDFSVTNAFLLIALLVAIDIFLSLLKQRSERLDQWLEGLPLVIVEHGRPLTDRMAKARVDETDILSAARQTQGIERMEQIEYAVLERNGAISVIKSTDAE